jgi:hypothetical protein
MSWRQECTHTDQIREGVIPSAQGCEECLRTGDRWVHLRECLICGHIGCCDQSENKYLGCTSRPQGSAPLAGGHGERRLAAREEDLQEAQ